MPQDQERDDGLSHVDTARLMRLMGHAPAAVCAATGMVNHGRVEPDAYRRWCAANPQLVGALRRRVGRAFRR